MTVFPFRIVGFDLDGTLLDTSRDLTEAVNHALGVAGRPPLTPDQVKPMIGGGAKRMLEHGLEASGGCPPDEFRRYYHALLAHYGAHISDHTTPFPGAIDALDRLAALGVRTGVVTNKFESLAVKLLTELRIVDRFETVIGGDTLGKENAKPSPAPIHALIERCSGGAAAFVGDSIYDAMAARAANVPFVAAGFGFLLGPVEDLGADVVLDHYDELIDALSGLAPLGP